MKPNPCAPPGFPLAQRDPLCRARLAGLAPALSRLGLLLLLCSSAPGCKCGAQGSADTARPPRNDQATAVRVEPGPEETVLSLDNGITVRLLGGLLEQEQTLRLAQRPPPRIPPNQEGLEPIAVVDVSLGAMHDFLEPVRIEVPLPPELGVEAQSVIACRSFLPDEDEWARIDCAVDAEGKLVTIVSHHLSTFGVFRLSTKLAYSRRFEYGKWAFRIIADPLVPLSTVDTVRAALEKASEVYQGLGFVAPSYRVDVNLLHDPPSKTEAHYSSAWLFGYIVLPIRDGLDSAALQSDAAHELFHAVQNININAARMNLRFWFVEATAEYAAGYAVFPGTSGIKALGDSWPETRLIERDPEFVYQSSHFVAYLLKQTQATLSELLDAVFQDGHVGLETLASPVVSSQKERDNITRALTLQPLDRFLERRLPEGAGARDLLALVRSFLAQALLGSDAPDNARLSPGLRFLSTRIDADQLTQSFFPYQLSAQQPLFEVPPDYGARIWHLQLSHAAKSMPRRLRLDFAGHLPEGLELALYLAQPQMRRAETTPLQVVRGTQRFEAIDLPAGHDLLVIAVNGSAQAHPLRLELTVERPETRRTVELGASLYAVDLPTWMEHEPNPQDATWSARAMDLKPFETLQAFIAPAPATSPSALCDAHAARAREPLSYSTALGSPKTLLVAGVEAELRSYRGQYTHRVAQRTLLYHGPQRISLDDPSMSHMLDVTISLLCLVKGEDGLVLEAVAAPDGALWVEPTLLSLRGGELPPGPLLSDDFESGMLSSEHFEEIVVTGQGVGFLRGQGKYVSMQPGFVRLHQAVEDRGGGLMSKAFAIADGHTLVIRSRHRLHPAAKQCREADAMTLDLLSGSDGLGNVGVGTVCSDSIRAAVGVISADGSRLLAEMTYMDFGQQEGFYWSRGQQLASPALWESWFRQELRWNPVTGDVSWSMNDGEAVYFQMEAAQTEVRVFFHAYGWGVGHAHDLDDVELFWEPSAEG